MRKPLLSPAEEEILKLSWQGMSSGEIALKLGKKLSNVSKTKGSIRRKVNIGLERLAKSLQLDYEELSHKDGRAILTGYHFAVDTPVYLLFTLKDGFIAWYRHAKCIRNDPRHQKCQEGLDLLRDERQIPVGQEENMSQEWDSVWKWLEKEGEMI
ncbi:MAG: hypothetical protein ACFFB3_08980 [Candidatus Hodarchaeota archaeon]